MTFEILRFITHYGLHFVFPVVIAWFFYRADWKKAFLIMVGAIIIDLDHLIANPIFDAQRCSIGFHPLHSGYAISIYILLLFFKPTRVFAVGLIWHIITDYQDCLWIENSAVWLIKH